MNSHPPPRPFFAVLLVGGVALSFLALLAPVGTALPVLAAGAVLAADPLSQPGSPPASEPAPTEPTVSPTLLPPYDGDTFQQQQPEPTRLDRIISAAAPIAMVLVLVSGLYIYWLIRKGL